MGGPRLKKRFLRWNKATGAWSLYEDDGWGADWLSRDGTSNVEELFYERCRSLLEGAIGGSVTVRIPFDRRQEELVIFRSMLCGVFRAAVYGCVSVMVCGCVTRTDLVRVRQEFARAFCDLERDGREFNGYIARGLLIESPVLLLSSQIAEGMDFLCFDAQKLGMELSRQFAEARWMTSIAVSLGK